MAVDDTWYLKKLGPDKKHLPAKKHGRGKRWRVRWNDDVGEPQERMFERKPDAVAFDLAMRSAVSRGVYVDPNAGKKLVREYGEEWRAIQIHVGNTEERVERTLRLHVYPTLGDLQLMQVRPSRIQSWVKVISATLAPSSVGVIYQVAQQMFASAALDRLIPATPFVNIALPDVVETDRFIATSDQVHELAASLPAWLFAQPYVAAGCGHRQGEVWGMEVEHIDFLKRQIRIEQQLCACRGREPHLALPKGGKTRTVELPTVTAERIARHIEEFPPVEQPILDERVLHRPVTRMVKLVFVRKSGIPMRRSYWTYPWAKAVKSVDGIPAGFGFHDLRHYYATLLINGGAGVKRVQRALGHSTPMITLNTYAGLWPEDDEEGTRGLVDAKLGLPRQLRRAQ